LCWTHREAETPANKPKCPLLTAWCDVRWCRAESSGSGSGAKPAISFAHLAKMGYASGWNAPELAGRLVSEAGGPAPTAPTWGARGARGAASPPGDAGAAIGVEAAAPKGKKGKKSKQLLFTTSQRGRS
jgi:hypothetical protein